MTPHPIHAALRDRTAAAHRALEAVMALTGPGVTRARYVAYLRTLEAFHAAVEPVLASDEALRALLPDLALRWRAPAAARDLRALGAAPSTRPVVLPPLASTAQRMGVLYVLEGSTLGGQVLRRKLKENMNLGDDALEYVTGAGENTGARWRTFLGALGTALSTDQALNEATDAAARTFSALHDRFEAEAPGAAP